jgi:hypothetical protein
LPTASIRLAALSANVKLASSAMAYNVRRKPQLENHQLVDQEPIALLKVQPRSVSKRLMLPHIWRASHH